MTTLRNCDTCMMSTPRSTRERLACGWLPAVRDAMPWSPAGYGGPHPTTCPGYTRALPEVLEAASARRHWEHGHLRDCIDGERPTELLLRGIEEFDTACSAVMLHYATAKTDGGGA